MAKTYKSDFEVFNGTDYDKHCFSTTADQVEMASGDTAEKALLEAKTLAQTAQSTAAKALGRTCSIMVLDVFIPASSIGKPSSFSLPIGYDVRECVIVPVGYYIGDSNNRRLNNFSLYGIDYYPTSGQRSFSISADYDTGDNSAAISFFPPADVGSVTVRLLLMQGEIEDKSSSAPVG